MTTIRDIAKKANCSVATVSKAINGRHDISEITRDRILKIVEKDNFVPNAFGKGLKNRKTENIGIIFCREFQPLSSNPFYSRVLEGIEAEIAINDYNLVLHLLPEVYRGEYPKMLKEHNVDGVILVGVLQEQFIKQLKSEQILTVLVDPQIITKEFSQVLIDNEHGAFTAAQYLINHGHKKIGFISGDLGRQSFQQRFNGFQKAMNYYNLKINEQYIQTGGLEMGYEHVKKLIKLEDRPTAIFSANDINAIYGYKAVKDANLQIPEDISMIGFDDIELAKISSPTLTTMRVYKEEMGSIAVRNLLKIIQKEVDLPMTTLVPVRLIERESVKSLYRDNPAFL